MRGVQKLLRDKSEPDVAPMPAHALPADEEHGGIDVFRLIALRDRLAAALEP